MQRILKKYFAILQKKIIFNVKENSKLATIVLIMQFQTGVSRVIKSIKTNICAIKTEKNICTNYDSSENKKWGLGGSQRSKNLLEKVWKFIKVPNSHHYKQLRKYGYIHKCIKDKMNKVKTKGQNAEILAVTIKRLGNQRIYF